LDGDSRAQVLIINVGYGLTMVGSKVSSTTFEVTLLVYETVIELPIFALWISAATEKHFYN